MSAVACALIGQSIINRSVVEVAELCSRCPGVVALVMLDAITCYKLIIIAYSFVSLSGEVSRFMIIKI